MVQRQPALEALICEKLLDKIETTPFHRIKVTDFVKFAEISRSSFYMHFDSIYSVVQKIEDDFLSGLTDEDEALRQPIHDREATKPTPFTLMKVEYIRRNQRLLRILTGPNGDPAFQARMTNRIWRMFKKRYENCVKLTEPEKKLVCEYLCGGQLNFYRWYASHENEISVYDMGLLLDKLLNRILSMLE